MIWFTADTHFDHPNILKHCAATRPWTCVEVMNLDLIHHWNSQVAPGDLVYHLGDFCWSGPSRWLELLKILHGQIILIRGNHDRGINSTVQKKLAGLYDLKTIHPGPYSITLCHYAMRTWPASHHGSWHLYGHSHGRLLGEGYSMDVGVDTNGMRLYSMPEIITRMTEKNLDNSLPRTLSEEVPTED